MAASLRRRRRRQLCSDVLLVVILVLCCIESYVYALVSPSTTTTTSWTKQTKTTVKPFVELVEPETNCRVVLLGCLHGSPSSAKDVQDLLLPKQTRNDGDAAAAADSSDDNTDDSRTVVVLELCASRVADLMRRRRSQQQHERRSSTTTTTTTPQSLLSSIRNYSTKIMRTNQEKGWAFAMVAAILAGTSGLQTALYGNNANDNGNHDDGVAEAGKEFLTALEVAHDQQLDVVLADQAVDQTLTKMGNLPLTFMSMIQQQRQQQSQPTSPTKSVGGAALSAVVLQESQSREALATAMFGDDAIPRPFQLHMAQVLTRNDDVVQDLVKLTLPPLAIALATVTAAEWLVGRILVQLSSLSSLNEEAIKLPMEASTAPTIDTTPLLDAATLSSWNAVGIMHMMVSSSLALLLGYVALVVPATQIVLCQRDEILTRGIRAACRHAASASAVHNHLNPTRNTKKDDTTNANAHDDDNAPARVVAVLGLLHVNGVAKRLLQPQSDDSHLVATTNVPKE